MKHGLTGLVCAGGVTQSFVARLPSVLAALGPVKSDTLRVARRLSNTLKVGYGTQDNSELRVCSSIWIAVPGNGLDRTLGGLSEHSGSLLVVCDSRRDSASMRVNGARLATLNAVDPGERILVAEGHADVLRILRGMAAREGRRLIELRPASKALFFAGVNLASQLMLPCFGAAVESLRAAGFAREDAARTAEALGLRALHGYTKAGRKAWSPGASPALREALEQELDSIRSVEPGIAEVYASAIAVALRYF